MKIHKWHFKKKKFSSGNGDIKQAQLKPKRTNCLKYIYNNVKQYQETGVDKSKMRKNIFGESYFRRMKNTFLMHDQNIFRILILVIRPI